jgi:alkylated DNA repair dioxygenase AlkB
MQPQGLYYLPNAFQGTDIIAALDQLPWSTVTASENSRRYQHFGSTYDYVKRKIIPDAAPIPEFLEPVRAHLAGYCTEHGLPSEFNQVIVNDYQPGQGISKHIDIKAYGPVIGCYTFGSGATMTFRRGEEIFHQHAVADSLYVMSGESRTAWTHEMASRKSDKVDGQTVKRGRRVSVTFRYAPQ